MRGNRCEVYINDVKSKLFPLGSSGCRSNLPAALFGMTVSINEAGKEKENISKQRDSKKSVPKIVVKKKHTHSTKSPKARNAPISNLCTCLPENLSPDPRSPIPSYYPIQIGIRRGTKRATFLLPSRPLEL